MAAASNWYQTYHIYSIYLHFTSQYLEIASSSSRDFKMRLFILNVNYLNSIQLHCMLGWTGDMGAKKVWEVLRHPKQMKKMLAVQFIQRCPTFVSILGKLNCKSYRSSSSGNSSKYQEKKMTPHRLVDFTKKNIQLLMDFAVYYRTKFKFKF